jgi:hypothetical protein
MILNGYQNAIGIENTAVWMTSASGFTWYRNQGVGGSLSALLTIDSGGNGNAIFLGSVASQNGTSSFQTVSVANGLTVTAGGLAVSAGSLSAPSLAIATTSTFGQNVTITSGGLSVTAGNLALSSGNISAVGSITSSGTSAGLTLFDRTVGNAAQSVVISRTTAVLNFSDSSHADNSGNFMVFTPATPELRILTNSVKSDSIQVNAYGTGFRDAVIDLIGSATYPFGLRIARSGAGQVSADTITSTITHRGLAAFRLGTQEAGAVEIFTTNTNRVTISAAGQVTMAENLVVQGASLSTFENLDVTNFSATNLVLDNFNPDEVILSNSGSVLRFQGSVGTGPPLTASESTGTRVILSTYQNAIGYDTDIPYFSTSGGFRVFRNTGSGGSVSQLFELATTGNGNATFLGSVTSSNGTSLFASLTVTSLLTVSGGGITLSGGNLIMTGDQQLWGPRVIELGAFVTGDRNCVVDFHSHGTSIPNSGTVGYSARIIRGAGANGDFAFENTGTGSINIGSNASFPATGGLVVNNGTLTASTVRTEGALSGFAFFDRTGGLGMGVLYRQSDINRLWDSTGADVIEYTATTITLNKQVTLSSGNMIISAGSLLGPQSIELNAYGTTDRNSFIDFHSHGTSNNNGGTVDYSARIIRGAGANGDFAFENTGSGKIRFNQAIYGNGDRIETQSFYGFVARDRNAPHTSFGNIIHASGFTYLQSNGGVNVLYYNNSIANFGVPMQCDVNLTVNGVFTVLGTSQFGPRLQIGYPTANNAVQRFAYLDFYTTANSTGDEDWRSRIIRNPGLNNNFQISNRGGNIDFITNGNTRAWVSDIGLVTQSGRNALIQSNGTDRGILEFSWQFGAPAAGATRSNGTKIELFTQYEIGVGVNSDVS